MARSAGERLLTMIRRKGVLGAKEASRAGIHSQVLTRLSREGRIERVACGEYRLAGLPVTEHHGLVLAARAAPRGVICLLSALAYHEIGSQLPFEVWIAVPRGVRTPPLPYPPLRVMRFSGSALTEGVEAHRIEREMVSVYGVAKTLADLFKCRHRIGLDVALEALREAWRERRVTMDEIDRYARVCRVEKVMRPYLESLVA